MLPPIERTAFDWTLFSMTGLSVALELFVLWLILTKSASSLNEYRFYLCGTTASDLLFAFIVGFVIEPDPWIPESIGTGVKGLARYLDTDFTAPLAVTFFLNFMIFSQFSLSVFALSCQLLFQTCAMVFRYVIVREQKHPRLKALLLHKWTKLVMLLYIVGMAFAVAGISFFAFTKRQALFINVFWPKWHFYNATDTPDPEDTITFETAQIDAMLASHQFVRYLNASPPDVAAQIERNFHRSMHYWKHVAFVFEAFRTETPILMPDWGSALPMLLTMGTLLSGLFLVQIVCVAMGVAIIRYLRQHSKDYIRQTYKLHMQLIVLLIIQLLEPILLIALPVVYVCYGLLIIVLQLDLPYHISSAGMHFGILLFAFYPTLNSLLTMAFVSSYRKFIFKALRLEQLAMKLRKLFGLAQNQVAPVAPAFQVQIQPPSTMYPVTTTKSG